MQGAFREPYIIGDAVFFQVGAQLLDIFWQGKVHQCLSALLLRAVEQAVPVDVGILLRSFLDVLAVVAVLRERNCLFAFKNLQISCFQRQTELFNLVAGIVDVKLSGHIVAAGIHCRCQAVADRAAACVAHVHRTGGVCGNKFHHHLFALAVVASAVVISGFQHTRYDVCKPDRADKKVDEARTCNLCAVDVTRFGKVHALHQRSCNFDRCAAEGLCRNHRCIGRKIAVKNSANNLCK